MKSQLNPYLSFRNKAREAMEFYKGVFGGKLTMGTFKESNASKDPSEDNLIMHSELKADNGIVFMASDVPARTEYRPGTNITMSLSGDHEEELRGYWDGLSKGATVREPLKKAPWGDTFGMLEDKFGIVWLVNISAPKA
jgi:PhnB protein